MIWTREARLLVDRGLAGGTRVAGSVGSPVDTLSRVARVDPSSSAALGIDESLERDVEIDNQVQRLDGLILPKDGAPTPAQEEVTWQSGQKTRPAVVARVVEVVRARILAER